MDDEVEPSVPLDTELVREAMTMALYLSLSLLAVIVAMPVNNEDHRVRAGVTLLVTALGLLLAHHLAFRMSSRLVNEGLLTAESVSALQAQALGGVPVAVAAALPVFFLGELPGEYVAELLLVAFVAIVGYRTARQKASPLRSLLYVLVIVLAALAVILVKLAVGH
jgi:FtsH-binding integral membrane protein